MFEIRCDTVSSEQSRAEPNRGSIICPGGNAVVASQSLEAYMLILRKALLIAAISGPLQLRARGTKLGLARIAPGARQPRRHSFRRRSPQWLPGPICGRSGVTALDSRRLTN